MGPQSIGTDHVTGREFSSFSFVIRMKKVFLISSSNLRNKTHRFRRTIKHRLEDIFFLDYKRKVLCKGFLKHMMSDLQASTIILQLKYLLTNVCRS